MQLGIKEGQWFITTWSWSWIDMTQMSKTAARSEPGYFLLKMDPNGSRKSWSFPMTKSLGQLFMKFIWHFQLEQTANHSRDAHQNFWHLRSSAKTIGWSLCFFKISLSISTEMDGTLCTTLCTTSMFYIILSYFQEICLKNLKISGNHRQPARQSYHHWCIFSAFLKRRSEARVLQRCYPRWSWGPDQSTWWRDRRHLCRPPPEATRSLASLGWEKWRGCMWLTTNTSQNYSLMSLRSKLSDLYKHAKCPFLL